MRVREESINQRHLLPARRSPQFAVKLGESFVDATLGTIDQIAIRENITPDQMQSPNYSFSESVTRQEVAVATEDDIMFNPFKFSYCRLVPTDSGSKKSLVQPYSSAVFESVAA